MAVLRVPPLIVGLTIVAFGTSAPEFAVSLNSAWRGDTELALGNVLGSNIFNILFILGISALITPLTVAHQLVRIDVPLMIGATALAFWLGSDGQFGTFDGLILFGGLVTYLVWIAINHRKSKGDDSESSETIDLDVPEVEGDNSRKALVWQIGVAIVGLLVLTAGSTMFVEGAVRIARLLNIDELVIGLTIVAVGTSLPEIATSVMASLRGERDMAVGNVVGSNLFNILGVLGLTSMVSPTGVPVSQAAITMDFPVALIVAVACFPIFFSWRKIARWEGGLFLAYYFAFTIHLILHAKRHDATDDLRFLILWVALPITILLIGFESWASVYKQRRQQHAEESSDDASPDDAS